jgi:hypothetical protein
MFDSSLFQNGEQIIVRKVLQLCRTDGTVLFEYADGELNVPLSPSQVKAVPAPQETPTPGVVLKAAVKFEDLDKPLQAFLEYFDKRSWRKICRTLANAGTVADAAREFGMCYNTLIYRMRGHTKSKPTAEKVLDSLQKMVPPELRIPQDDRARIPDTVYLLEENGQPIEVGSEAFANA